MSAPAGAPALAAMEVRNFDFLAGAWRARERSLKQCGVGCTEWVERDAYLIMRPLIGGLANAEEITYPGNPEFGVATFRCYDIAAAEWIIQSYVAATHAHVPGMYGGMGVLIPPLRGRFAAGSGEFIGESEHEGKSVKVKYVWRDITALSANWERWFSFDQGASWERNISWSQVRERTLA